MAGLNQEIWTDTLVQDFRATEEAAFLSEIPDESRHVAATRGEHEVIHLVDVGADPEVIVNNVTYPIGITSQDDKDIPISLDTYVTKATKVTQEELEHVSYDKIRLVQQKHKTAVMRVKHNKAIHALAPTTDKTATPILKTTGPDAGDGSSRRMLLLKDLFRLKNAYDAQKIPLDKRILVLTSEHYNDLLSEAIEAKKSIDHLSHDESGLLKTRLFGFKTYMYVDAPYFDLATLAKKDFGAIVEPTDVQGTVSYYAPDMFRASGLTKNYEDEPTTQNHAWLYNIRHNYIVLPRKQRAIGAIISDKVA